MHVQPGKSRYRPLPPVPKSIVAKVVAWSPAFRRFGRGRILVSDNNARPPKAELHTSAVSFGRLILLKLSFGAGDLADDPGVALTGKIGGLGEGFEQCFDYMVRFGPVEEFQVQVAAGFVGEALEELTGEAE